MKTSDTRIIYLAEKAWGFRKRDGFGLKDLENHSHRVSFVRRRWIILKGELTLDVNGYYL